LLLRAGAAAVQHLLRMAEFAAGLVIVLLTWADVFSTVVLPLHVQSGLAIGARLRRRIHPLWTRLAQRAGDERRHRLLSGFAGGLLLVTFMAWMLLSLAGFTLMTRGLSGSFKPQVRDMSDALATAGSAMVTLSTNDHAVNALSSMLAFFAAVSGLGVITLTLTYILQVQSGLTQRDSMVQTLPSRAGSPPSGIVLLETMGKLDLTDKLAVVFHDWEQWCAGLLNSHTSHPVLVLFRSPDPRTDWLTALGAVLDAAALAKVGLKDGPQQAQFFLSMGVRTVTALCEIFDLQDVPDTPLEPRDIHRAVERLRRAGLELSPDPGLADRLNAERATYAGHIAALSKQFGVQNPPWLGPEQADELVTTE
jgi:hypothetical protein